MATVNIHEAKTHLSRLLERVQGGESITIAKAGKPIAELRPISRVDVVFGSMADVEMDYSAFEEADAEVLEMFDQELGLTR